MDDTCQNVPDSSVPVKLNFACLRVLCVSLHCDECQVANIVYPITTNNLKKPMSLDFPPRALGS